MPPRAKQKGILKLRNSQGRVAIHVELEKQMFGESVFNNGAQGGF